jgi:parallel beta-helix repeat protein
MRSTSLTLFKSVVLAIVALVMLAVVLFVVPEVQAADCPATNLRWAATSNSLYVSGPVSCTLTDIKAGRPSAPLTLVDSANKIWLLKANLILQNGAKLNLHGTSAGGDVNELRLVSNNSTAVGSTIFVRAYWGEIDINKTKIISWNEAANGPDTEYATYKRSFIHARSFLDGTTARESRMNIVDSEIGYLGFFGAEAYGLSWKVLGITPGIYDQVNVYGNVVGSNIHHNYFGAYTYGADSMLWENNQIHDNVAYGLDPHDDSDNLTIVGNNLYNNGNHGLICSKRCNNLTIRNNSSHNNTGNGIMLHRNTNDSLVENNTVNDNGDSGIAIFDSHNNTITGNTSLRNKNGIRLSVGSSENVVENNEFGANTKYGIYFYKGSDTPSSGDGRPKQNQFIGNNIHDNGDYMIKLKEGDNNTFENNTLRANARELVMENAQGNTFINNSLSGNTQNFYHAKLGSNGTIKDTSEVRAKIGDMASSLDIVNSQNKIFQNSLNLATLATPDQTSVTFTRSLSGSVVTFTPQTFFSVKPTSGQISVSPLASQKWSEKASLGDLTSDHSLENLSPNQSFDIVVNGTVWQTLTSDSEGTMAFNYNGGYSANDNFELRPASALQPFSVLNEATSTPTASPSGSPTPSLTPSPTETPLESPSSPTESPSPTPIESPTETPSASPTEIPTSTSTPIVESLSPTPSLSPAP